MKKKRLTLLALMMALLMVLSMATLVACNKADSSSDDDTTADTTIEATEGLLISNSDFKVVNTASTAKYPLSITGWTGATSYSSGTYNTGVIAGAISLEEALYSANRTTWKDNGGTVKDDSTLYDLLKSHYSADEGAVNNALMIYMPTAAEVTDKDTEDYGPTAYGYTSSSFTLDAGTYYKLSIDVLTYKIAGVLGDDGNQKDTATPGARIYVSSAAYAEYKTIDTNGEWTTYTVYFQSAATSTTSLTLQLALGAASSTNTTNGLTTGYAFFDNVALTEVEESAYNSAVVSEANDSTSTADEEYRKTNTTVSCLVPNGRFDFGTTSVGSSASASNWSVVLGNKSADDTAPSSSYYTNGIIDVSKFADNYSSYSNTYYQVSSGGSAAAVTPASRLARDNVASIISSFGDTRVGTNVYMLSQQTMTAQGLASSKKLVVEKGKCYAISVSVYTYDVRGAGVTLELSGDGNPILIKGISANKSNESSVNGLYMYEPAASNGGWTDYTFYIEGNQYSDKSYTMTFWLGTGGTNDNTSVSYTYYSSTASSGTKSTTYTANGTFSTGWAFFDELKLNAISSTEFSNAGSGAAAQLMKDATSDGISADGTAGFVKVSLKTDNLFLTDTTIDADFVTAADDATSAYDNGTLGTPDGFTSALDATDTTAPYVSADILTAGVVSIADGADFSAYGVANPGTPYDIVSERAYMLNAKSDTAYAVQTDLFTVKANSFYRISMWVKTEGIKSTSGLYVYLLDDEDATKSSFTLINTTDYTDDEEPSEWKEYTFYIRGANAEDTDLRLKFALGSGNRWASSTLADGAAFIANLSMSAITYSGFSGVSTSTTVKSIDMSSTYSYSFTNGGFDNFDLSSTKGLTTTGLAGQLGTEAGVPSNWTLNNTSYAPLGDDADDDNIYNGKTYTDDDNLVAGIIKMDTDAANDKYFRSSAQIENLFGSSLAANFNSLYGAEDGTYFDNYQRIGGPSLLALAGLNGKKYFRSYKSDSFSLSSGTNYEISVWVKNVGAATYSVYLTGASGGMTYFGQQNNFVVKNDSTTDWTKYTFYVEVGLTSVSLNLVLCLGYDSSISGTVATADEFSSGIVLFDNVTKHSTLTSDEFDAITETTIDSGTERKVSFLSDGFEIADGTTYSGTTPIKPSNFTGAVGTDQTAANTSGGVVYTDNSGYTYSVDAADAADDLYKNLVNSGYASMFGATYTVDDYDILQTEIEAKRDTYPGKSDTEIELILKKLAMYKDMADNYITVDELKKVTDNNDNDISSTIGDSYLVINNKAASAYTYTSSSYTFSAETVYRVSVWVRSYNVTANSSGASVQLYLGSANEADSPLIFKNITGTTNWTKYSFYVKTLDESVTSVTIKLGLGEYNADTDDLLSSGYAMFDAVEIEIVDDETFTTLAEEAAKDNPDATIYDAAVMKVHTVPEGSEEGSTDTDEDTTETPSTGFNLDYLWWMIPTILLALATIAVVIAFFVKKIKKPKKTNVEVDEELSTEAIDEKHSRYDDYNE